MRLHSFPPFPAPRWRPPLPLGHRAQVLRFPIAPAAPKAGPPPRLQHRALEQLRQAYLEQRSCQW